MKICLKVNFQRQKAMKFAASVIKVLLDNGAVLSMDERARQFFSGYDNIVFYRDEGSTFQNADCVVTIGGDGTIIRNALFAAKQDIPLVGINAGRVGYAAELEPTEIDLLKKIFTGDYSIEERMMFDVTIETAEGEKSYSCINDVVISRGQLSRIIDMTLFLNGERTMNYRADGLIFATPTGSTAYSLSAGGPVVQPTMQCIVMTPICPYALMDKTIIFAPEAQLSVVANRITDDDLRSFVTIDGQTVIPLSMNDRVKITRSPLKFKLISLKERNFCRLVGQKLKEDY